MGNFVLGILVGWLAEWLFYTFWVKKSKDNSDCSEIETELELKNRQISSLQELLASVSGSTQGTATNEKANTSTAKKTSTTKTTTGKSSESSTSNQALTKQKTAADDFTRLTGIGPSMSAELKNLGIDTFQKLASTDDDILRDMLEASGARMNNNKEAMDSWNEQATVAATGDFKALRAMQAALKK